jgi:hypothetical protein
LPGWCLEEARGPYGKSLWRNIRNGRGALSNFVSYKVGDGSLIHVWHDVLCGEEALKYSFLEFYSIARKKKALVSNYLGFSSSLIHWNLSFIRVVQD